MEGRSGQGLSFQLLAIMEKPKIKQFIEEAYDWAECQRWLYVEKGIDVRNYYQTNFGDGKPYVDFFDYLVERYSVKNDSFFTVNVEEETSAKWVNDILNVLKNEFDPENKGYIHFFVSW
jgi:hypothetical protein